MITTLYRRIQKERESPNYRYFDETIDPKNVERVASVAAWMGLGPTGLSVAEKLQLANAYANRVRSHALSRMPSRMPGWTRRFIQEGSRRVAPHTTIAAKIEAFLMHRRTEPLPDDMMFDESNAEGLVSMAANLGIGPTGLSCEEKTLLANMYRQRAEKGVCATVPGWTKRYPIARTPRSRGGFWPMGAGGVIVHQVIHLNPLVARGMFESAAKHVSPMIRDTLEIGYLDSRNAPLASEHATRLSYPHTIIFNHPPEPEEIDLSIADLIERACDNDPEPKWIGVRDMVLLSTHQNRYNERHFTVAVYITSAYSTTREEWINPQIERNYL